MTYAQLGDLRLATIYRLTFNDNGDPKFEPTDILDCGIHLDKRCADGEHWFAIAAIKYDSKDERYNLESVGSRLMDELNADNIDDVKYLVDYAYKLMRKEWNKRYPDDYPEDC